MVVGHIQTSGVLGPLVSRRSSIVNRRGRQAFIKIRTDSFASGDDDSDGEMM